MGFSTAVWLFIIANTITFIGYVMYAVSRFAKLENDVKHIRREIDDIMEMKQVVYRIHAQNEVILSVKCSSPSMPNPTQK